MAAAPSNPYYKAPPAFILPDPRGTDVQLTDTSQFVDALNKLSTNKAYQVNPINYGVLNTQASKSAAYDIAQQIKAYHQEQNRLLLQGNQQAGMINAAGAAAAKATTPYAGMIQNAYLKSAADMRNVGAGTSADLQAAMEADNAKINSQLQAIGSPQHADAALPGALATGANVLGGVLPSGTLDTQGANAYTAALAIPAAFRGYAQQTAVGTLGAARQEAAKYNLDIGKVLATRSKLTQDYATTYADQAQKAQKFILDMRNSNANLIGKYASIAQQSNAGKIALAKLQSENVKTYNGVIKDMNTYNLSVGKAMESWRHNKITEGQRDQQIQQATDRLTQQANFHADNYGIAQTNAQTAIANSVGYWIDDAHVPHPIKGYHLVKAPNDSLGFRAVKDVTPSKSGKTAALKNRATVAKMAKIAFEGQQPRTQWNADHTALITPGIDPKTGKLFMINSDTRQPTTPDDPKAIVDPRAEQQFESAGGKFKLDYWTAIAQIRSATGLSIPYIRAQMDIYPWTGAEQVPQMTSTGGQGLKSYGGR